jgi:acyl-[acyl-carrier-protein]-phospholipid O-acyltransferase/long-chain-fatty-acid--[acyl-carrier-protein] ligase
MFSKLMSARRFAPLFWCQFFSAFNDNFVRQMLAMLILFRLGEEAAGSLITLAVGIFTPLRCSCRRWAARSRIPKTRR